MDPQTNKNTQTYRSWVSGHSYYHSDRCWGQMRNSFCMEALWRLKSENLFEKTKDGMSFNLFNQGK